MATITWICTEMKRFSDIFQQTSRQQTASRKCSFTGNIFDSSQKIISPITINKKINRKWKWSPKKKNHLPTAFVLTRTVETLITGLRVALYDLRINFSSCFCSSIIISSNKRTCKSIGLGRFAILQTRAPSYISLCFVRSKFCNKKKYSNTLTNKIFPKDNLRPVKLAWPIKPLEMYEKVY